MAKNTDKLEQKIRSRAGAAERIDARTQAMRVVLRLSELRKELDTTQVELAKLMRTSQENISRIERADNLYLSTLASYIAGVGGHLEINAVFDDRVIPLATVEEELPA